MKSRQRAFHVPSVYVMIVRAFTGNDAADRREVIAAPLPSSSNPIDLGSGEPCGGLRIFDGRRREAMAWGLEYLDRFYSELYDAAVMKDAPSFPLYVYSHSTRTYRQPGQESVRIVVEQEGDGYGAPTIARYSIRDSDRGDFNDLILRVEIKTATFDPPIMQYKVQKVSGNDRLSLDLYVGERLIVESVNKYPTGSSWIINRVNGYPSIRYVARHTTRIAGWLYEDFGRINRARKLHAFMNEHGWPRDFYAPVWGRSNRYASLPWRTHCAPLVSSINDPLYNEIVFPDRRCGRSCQPDRTYFRTRADFLRHMR